MSNHKIPFNRVEFLGDELEYMARTVSEGHTAGDGPFTRRCQELLREELGATAVLLTSSGTHALEMAALLVGVGPEDEVIVPSFTFVSTAGAFALFGARPVFCDIRPDTFNLDEGLLEDLITPRTRAVVPVHYGGVGCEMEAIVETARRHSLVVVEDNAHGLFGTYQGRQLGGWGAMAALSFHETKNFTCGEGGALIINDASLVERAEVIREKGTDRSRFFRGQVDKYTWVDLGSSYLMSEISAAFLLAQLEKREEIQRRRRRIWEYYYHHLEDWSRQVGVRLPVIPNHCQHSCHLFYLLMPSLDARQSFITHMRRRGILAVFHYLPLHLSPMGRRFGGQAGACPVSEDISDRLVRLPFYTRLSLHDQEAVVEAVCSWKG